MKAKLILVFLIGLSFAACSHPNQGDGNSVLTLTLTLDKEIYHIGDPIQATLLLKNTSGESLLIKKRMAVNRPFEVDINRDIVFMITYPSGETDSELQAGYLNIRGPKRPDFVTLAPGEVIENKFSLAKLYWLREPGAYSVYAIYLNVSDHPDGTPAWKGELKSNAVTFKIEP